MDIPKFEEIFKQITINLRLSGINGDSTKLGLRFYILIFALSLMMIAECSFFVSRISSENFLELTALAPCVGIGVLSAIKILCIALKRHEVNKLIKCLGELYEDFLQDDNKKALIGKEINLVKSLTKYYFVLNAILISVYNFSTLFLILYEYLVSGVVKLILPYAVLVPFSTDVWQNWALVYSHSVVCGFICVLYYTTVDTLYCNLTSQVCNNFTVLSNEIEQLTPANAQSLRKLIIRHQYLIELSKTLEEIFTTPNLCNVLVGSVEICALGFNILTGDLSSMPGFILFLLSEILQILIMSIFGENLMQESKKVGDAAYLCDWYNMEQKYKKMILIVMSRSHKPQKLTAYKFSTISYGSFTKIISTAWSYFTILKTIYKPSDVDHSGDKDF